MLQRLPPGVDAFASSRGVVRLNPFEVPQIGAPFRLEDGRVMMVKQINCY